MVKIDNFDLAIRPELRLLACCVGLLSNRCVLYHILVEKSIEINKKDHDLLRSRGLESRELEIRDLGIDFRELLSYFSVQNEIPARYACTYLII